MLSSLTRRRLSHFDIDFECSEEVTLVKFEDYWVNQLECRNIDFVKLDIEGHELDALSGFGKAIESVRLIQFEFGGCNIDTRTYFQDFWYFFEEKGFDIYRITPLGLVKILKYNEMDEVFITTNFLAIKAGKVDA